ncbi:MAG: phosphohistidine phosphatase SixA [Phycisphaerae bacterium]
MRLYIVRHADAKSKSEDPERHLSETGLAQARAMADFLRPLGLTVAAVWHSTKSRAAETAACLAAAVEAADGGVERDDLAPKDPVDPVVRAVRKADGDVMVVGHLPYVENLASKLLTGDASAMGVRFPAAGVLCLDYEADEGWRVAWMVTPQLVSRRAG